MRPDSSVVTETTDAIHHEAVIPAKAGIHFDFSAGGAATALLSHGVRMRNPEDSPFVFVFDSDPHRPGVKTSERGGEKAKAKMDSGFRRNDGQNSKSGGGAGVTSSSIGFFNTPLKGGVMSPLSLAGSLRRIKKFAPKRCASLLSLCWPGRPMPCPAMLSCGRPWGRTSPSAEPRSPGGARSCIAPAAWFRPPPARSADRPAGGIGRGRVPRRPR